MLICTGNVCVYANVQGPYLRPGFKSTMVINGVGYLCQIEPVNGLIMKGQTCLARFTIIGAENKLLDFVGPSKFDIVSSPKYGFGELIEIEKLQICKQDHEILDDETLKIAKGMAQILGIPIIDELS